jgi:hypothetical protein
LKERLLNWRVLVSPRTHDFACAYETGCTRRSRQPRALEAADELDSGGWLAFARCVPPYDATPAKNVRDAGAMIVTV